MLRNIKSLFITKKVFDYISIIKKLKLLKYNKTIQNVFSIKIIDYKILSKRYIINENGIRKEYNLLNNKLLFEGEYLKRKRNGKGKEYNDDGELIFEGEYLNGKRNGKGKEYYNGELIFEGEYINEEKNGKGKEYDYDGKLIFEGEYLNGKRWNGKGKEYNKYDIFEEEYLNGKIIK